MRKGEVGQILELANKDFQTPLVNVKKHGEKERQSRPKSGEFNRELKSIKENPMNISQAKKKIYEAKKLIDELNSRFDAAEKKVHVFSELGMRFLKN